MNALIPSLWSLLSHYFLPGVRILSFCGINILFSHASIPRHIRLIIGMTLCIPLAHCLPQVIDITHHSWPILSLLILHEFLVGSALAMLSSCIFAGFLIAGEKISLQIGLGFASFYDPSSKASTEMISSFFQLLALTLFISTPALSLCLQALYHSFKSLPMGINHFIPWSMLTALLHFSGTMFLIGLMIALPYTTILLIINIGLGVLNRSSPQMNLFSLGLQINVIIGLFLLFIFIKSGGHYILHLFKFLPQWIDLIH